MGANFCVLVGALAGRVPTRSGLTLIKMEKAEEVRFRVEVLESAN
jgi:hypothetical protein